MSSMAESSSLGPRPEDVLDVALEQLVQCLTPTPQAWSRRQSLVYDHIQRLEQYWRANHNIRIQPFGSSLSGLCLADSDIDLGLFGSMHHVELESITPQQAKKILYSVLNGIHRAQLADGKVHCVMGARVPVLKYKCALSGLDCDISIQGSGALVKANFMRLINQHCRTLSPLYRLVKLWASAHDVNDASRSTFNSTSLLYLTVLYLQTRGLVPPLQELVDPALLNDPARRLLCPPNKWLWDRSEHLQRLLDAAQGRFSAWVQAQRQKAGPNWDHVSIGALLQGFFAFYASVFTDWVVGKHREVYADLWAGHLSSQHPQEEQLGKDYLFNLQDPFDPADCPARAIGTLSKTNNGVGILITYLFCSSQRVFQRYNGSSSTHQSTLDGTISSSTGSADATGGLRSIGSLQDRLCQCLAWLFGPQAVLHLAQHDAAAAAGGVASSIPWRHWAACPFDAQLAEKIQARIQQQRQQQQQSSSHGRSGRVRAETPAIQFRWLINHLRAAVEPEAGPCVLCLEHLQLLNKRIEAGALHGALGAALAATAAGRRAAQHVNRQQLEDARHQWQQRRLPGPPLPQPDEHIVLVFKQLQLTLGSKRWQPKGTGGKKRKPVENSKAVKDAARHAVTQVALRMLELGTSSSAHRQHADPWEADAEDPAADMFGEAPVASAAAVAEEEEEEADGIGGFGLAAVLEQHGFIPLLQRWDFVDSNGTIWPKLLPLPEHLKPKRGGGAGLAAAEAFVSSSGGMVGAASDLAAAAMHAAADLMHLHSAHVDATADHDSSQPHQQQQQRGTGVFVSSRQFLNKVLQEQQQGQQHQQRKHSHHNQHQQQQARDEHRQQDEGMALQFDMELHTHTTTEGVVTSSSVAVTGMTDNLQHLTVGIDITSHAAGAGGSSSHSQDGAQHTAAQQCNRQQHGKVRAVRHQAELVGFPGYGSTESGGSSGFAAMSSPPAAAQSAGSQGFMSPLGGKPPGRQSKSQQKPQHQQQQQQGSGESAGGSRGGAKAAPVRQSPKLLARRRQYGCSPDAAVASVPIDFEPVGVQGLAMHGDGLAESYCRQLQEKLSSPASTQQPPPVLTHTTQQQQQEVQHPAAILLTSATSGLVTAGSSGSQGMGGFSPPAAAGSYGSASSSHGVTSPLSNKPQLRLQQATYKVKQLQQQISKTKAQVAVRQAEVAQHKKQIHDILGPNGKEYLLAPGDRAVLMEAKNSLMSSEKALKMQQGNLERALQKLPDLQRDLEAAQAAAAAQQAFAP